MQNNTLCLVAIFDRPIGPSAVLVDASVGVGERIEGVPEENTVTLLESSWDPPLTHCTDPENFITFDKAESAIYAAIDAKFPSLFSCPTLASQVKARQKRPEDDGNLRTMYGGPDMFKDMAPPQGTPRGRSR